MHHGENVLKRGAHSRLPVQSRDQQPVTPGPGLSAFQLPLSRLPYILHQSLRLPHLSLGGLFCTLEPVLRDRPSCLQEWLADVASKRG